MNPKSRWKVASHRRLYLLAVWNGQSVLPHSTGRAVPAPFYLTAFLHQCGPRWVPEFQPLNLYSNQQEEGSCIGLLLSRHLPRSCIYCFHAHHIGQKLPTYLATRRLENVVFILGCHMQREYIGTTLLRKSKRAYIEGHQATSPQQVETTPAATFSGPSLIAICSVKYLHELITLILTTILWDRCANTTLSLEMRKEWHE